MADTEVVVHQGREVTAADFTPIFSVEEAIERKKQIGKIISGVLNDGTDYGKMPGGRDTKVLMKPGAEKLASMFGLTPRYIAEVEIEDWTGADHDGEALFYYKYRCQLFRGDRLLGEAIGSCSSWESKYRYRWITSEECAARGIVTDGLPSRGGIQTITEPEFAISKGQTDGKYGKPAEYWERLRQAIKDGTAKAGEKPGGRDGVMKTWSIHVDAKLFRIPNPDTADAVNTIQKMAQKRAFVAVVLVATNASDSFTQDLEDFSDIDTGSHPLGTQEAADRVAADKIAKGSAKQAGNPPTPAAEGRGESATTAPIDPEFEELAAEALKSLGSYNKVASGLLDKIGAEYGIEARTKVWNDAVASVGRRTGDGARRDVILFIYKAASVLDAPKQEVA